MKIKYPNSNQSNGIINLEKYNDNGVYCLIPEDKKEKLAYFLKAFQEYRTENEQRILNVALYKNLPFSIADVAWKSKQKDIKIVTDLCQNKTNLKILDIGAWNGWLSNHLSKNGHQIVATDIFLDAFDGLKALQHYNNDFLALQLFPNELWRIEATFDVIIFNRNWAYIENKEAVFLDVKKLLKPHGKILFTGLTFFRDASKIEQQLQKMDVNFKTKYNIPILYFKTKGYLNYDDYTFFKEGFKLYPYNAIKHFIKKMLFAKSYFHYAIYTSK